MSGSQGVPAATRSGDRGMEEVIPQKGPTLPTPGSRASGLLTWERIQFCSLKPPVCGGWLWQPRESNTPRASICRWFPVTLVPGTPEVPEDPSRMGQGAGKGRRKGEVSWWPALGLEGQGMCSKFQGSGCPEPGRGARSENKQEGQGWQNKAPSPPRSRTADRQRW